MTYTTTDYLAIIRRELAKRQTAYPKIMKKKVKEGYAEAEQIELANEHRAQYELLTAAENVLLLGPKGFADFIVDIWRELLRELRMRKKCYPRWVAFQRMDADTAAREIHAWQALTDHFHETYCPDAPLRARRKALSH